MYSFDGFVSSPEKWNWTEVLARAHAAKIHPLCLCSERHPKPSMVLAKLNDGTVIVKRMPFSGALHAPHCEHYEPPPELSGLGQVNGSAIRVTPETDTTTLAFDFALSKGRTRAISTDSAEVEHDSVRNDGTKLTLRAALHYLYDQAGLTRWSPKMVGRRSWAVVRRELLQAADGKTSKGRALQTLLFIPETYSVESALEIQARRVAALNRLAESASKYMLLIAEVKAFEPVRFGYRMVLKHLPDMGLLVNDELQQRIQKHFANQLALWDQLAQTHLLMIGTMSMSKQGVHRLESACFMNVSDAWMPFESVYEHELMARLHRDERRFTRGLRYNLPRAKPLASVVLQDTGAVPVAMYTAPAGAAAAYQEAALQLAEHTGMASWLWDVSVGAMPELPQRRLGAMERPLASLRAG